MPSQLWECGLRFRARYFATSFLIVIGSLTCLDPISTVVGQDASKSLSSEGTKYRQKPLAVCEAGNYVLEAWSVDDIDASRSCHEIVTHMLMTMTVGEPENNKERFQGPNGGGMVGGGGMTGNASGGGGGSFRGPKKVIGIRVLDKRTRTLVKDTIFGGGYSVVENDGKKGEATLPPSFLQRYFWPDSESQAQAEVPTKQLTPLPVFVNDPKARSFKSLEGTLVVRNDDFARIVFNPAEIKNKARKNENKFVIEIESIGKKDSRIAVDLLLTLPPQTRSANRMDPKAFMQEMRARMGKSLFVYALDSNGGIHVGSPQNRSGGGGSGGGSFSFTGPDGKQVRGSNKSGNVEPPEKYPFTLSPTPEGASTKELVCEARKVKESAIVVPFKFENIVW